MAVLALTAIFAPFLLSERAGMMGTPSQPASWQHPLGTNSIGHDMLARTLVSTRLSLLMAFGATGLSMILGVGLGSLAWLLPRVVRKAIIWFIDTMVAFPGLLLALVIAAIMGPGANSVVIAFGVAAAPSLARLTSNLGSQVSRKDFVTTARGIGVPPLRLLQKHILPNMAEPLLIVIASQFAQSLVSISALSFVGLGVQSPQYDFGKLLAQALPGVFSGNLVQLVGPAFMIVLTGLAGMLIGDGLAARRDPRLRVQRVATRGLTNAERPESSRPLASETSERDLVLRLDDLSVTTPEGSTLVDRVSIRVGRGEIIGIVGESGSGKSLMSLAIAQLLPPSLQMKVGRLEVDGLDLGDRQRPTQLTRAMSMVYQDPMSTFNPALRIGTHLAEAMRVNEELSKDDVRRISLAALKAVHIPYPEMRLRQYPRELSGGMRQRVMIASAIASGSALLIADEPTTALDVTVQAEILQELYRLNQSKGLAMIFISHDLGVVSELCSRVYVMKSGRIVEEIEGRALVENSAQHPYTRKLAEATPTLQTKRSDS